MGKLSGAPAWLRAGAALLGMSGLVGAGCSSSSSGEDLTKGDCPVGSERCPCTQGGSCDPELTCRSQLCVRLPSSGTGGGTGHPDASSGDGGAPSSGGSTGAGGASSTVDGGGGSSGADGGSQPSLPACTSSADCATDEVCVVKADGSAYCLKGSGKDCTHGDACIHDMGFDSTAGKIEGSACSGPDDCQQAIEGQLNAVCALHDAGQNGTCVALCQYGDDPANMNCVTHPWIGLNTDCTRDQIRTIVWWITTAPCVDYKIVTWSCRHDPRPITADEDWMLSCIDSSMSCAPLNCFYGSSSPPQAKLGINDYLDLLDATLDYATAPISTGGSSSGACGADCDCGHCEYCESTQCRYGGEGPYGCYRGCD